jgi:pimeloyl-ACP methyl ester carboxylesterase
MWYRAPDWQPCKAYLTAQTRFDRYEIYSGPVRHWASAIDLEQVYFSFQDKPIAPSPNSRLFLAAGEKDNYDPVNIYNSTISVANHLSGAANGRAEFWLDTGHSFHDERPHLFATEIALFLNNPSGTKSLSCAPAKPKEAPNSRTDQ